MLLLPKVVVCDGGDQEGRVSGPLLDAGQVEEREAAAAAPHRLRPLDRGNADETGESSGLEQLAHILTGSDQPRRISACLAGVGGEGGGQDLPSLSIFVVVVIVGG